MKTTHDLTFNYNLLNNLLKIMEYFLSAESLSTQTVYLQSVITSLKTL